MERNNKLLRRGRGTLSILLGVFFLILFSIPSLAYSYTNDYPVYLPYVGAKYVEIQSSSLGKCTIVLSASVPDSYISIGTSNNNLYNNTSSTLYGMVRTINGTDYSIRFPAFSTAEYYTAGSYNPTYSPINCTQIYNTNIRFVDYNDTNKQNDSFIITDNVERLHVILAFADTFLLTMFFFIFLLRRSES